MYIANGGGNVAYSGRKMIGQGLYGLGAIAAAHPIIVVTVFAGLGFGAFVTNAFVLPHMLSSRGAAAEAATKAAALAATNNTVLTKAVLAVNATVTTLTLATSEANVAIVATQAAVTATQAAVATTQAAVATVALDVAGHGVQIIAGAAATATVATAVGILHAQTAEVATAVPVIATNVQALAGLVNEAIIGPIAGVPVLEQASNDHAEAINTLTSLLQTLRADLLAAQTKTTALEGTVALTNEKVLDIVKTLIPTLRAAVQNNRAIKAIVTANRMKVPAEIELAEKLLTGARSYLSGHPF